MDSLRLSILKILSCMDKNLSLLPFPIWLLFVTFSYLAAQARLPGVRLKSEKMGVPVVPSLGREQSVAHIMIMMSTY